jgi:SAM-dependent methyltransferase
VDRAAETLDRNARLDSPGVGCKLGTITAGLENSAHAEGRRAPRHLVSRWVFEQVCATHQVVPEYDDERFRQRFFGYDVESTARFFARFKGRLDVEGKSVLDVGCGRGAACVGAARRGAARVVGVDLDIASQTRELIAGDPELAARIELVRSAGTLEELGSETFDVVLSKDCFEHYADPECFVHVMGRLVRPGGSLAIGFGPLWKSPTGGHIEYMTRLPWAHLLFPEDVIMAERKRFRPAEDARSFEEIRGGLNKMTLARFLEIMRSTGLEQVYLETNVSDHPAVRAMKQLAHVRPLRELFTTNVYGIWRKA